MGNLGRIFGTSRSSGANAPAAKAVSDVSKAEIEKDLTEFDQIAASTNDPVVKGLAKQARNWFTLEKWGGKPKTLDPTFDFQELMMEADRGCWLSACSFIDALLKESIRKKFVDLSKPSKADIDLLLDTEGMLGTFGGRITAARVLGLIDDKNRDALRALKKVRNTNAHSWKTFHFTRTNVYGVSSTLGKKHSSMIEETGEVFDKVAAKLNPFHASNPHKMSFIFLTALLIKRVNSG